MCLGVTCLEAYQFEDGETGIFGDSRAEPKPNRGKASHLTARAKGPCC